MANIALPTKNIVTQTAAEHGYAATDYDDSPDPDVHACVTGWATAGGNPNNNPYDPTDCGWMIEQLSDDGMWKVRLCHNEKTSWTRKYFKMGQIMAKIGYSGYTKPADARGKHIHLVLFKKSGDNWVRIADPDAKIRSLQVYIDETYKQIKGGYSLYKQDLTAIFGYVPPYFGYSASTGWPKYQNWGRAKFLKQLAITGEKKFKACEATQPPVAQPLAKGLYEVK